MGRGDLGHTPHVRLEWRETRHRVQGSQRLPASAWIDRLDDALAWIGKRAEHARFRALHAETATRQPAAALAAESARCAGARRQWSRLLDVVAWLQAHPRLAFICARSTCPASTQVHRIPARRARRAARPRLARGGDRPGRTGAQQFAARYGFLDKPALLRLRVLDLALGLLPGAPRPDLALDADSFARLRLDVARVFITENETNFRLSPRRQGHRDLRRRLRLGGPRAPEWLQRCPIHYWGDIDTNGFAILAQLRARFAHVESPADGPRHPART